MRKRLRARLALPGSFRHGFVELVTHGIEVFSHHRGRVSFWLAWGYLRELTSNWPTRIQNRMVRPGLTRRPS